MIVTEGKKGESVKEIRKREAEKKEAELREKLHAIANERFGEEQMKKWSVEHKGLWFLPIIKDNGDIEKLGILKPINRSILSYASTKVQEEGLYEFLETAMRQCWVAGDNEILEDDDYFIPSAMKFNAILEGKKAALVKR
ncbi:MAG: hypothetical protein HOP30_21705 [Cyclobacteriaceae bacterium]|nr:hypothetical protein [Cyclobacteriaceae bacterium]